MSFEPPDLLGDTDPAPEAEEDLAPERRSRVARWALALIACLVVTAMILSLLPSGGRPSRSDTVSGVVSAVGADGSSFCVVLDSTGRPFCSDYVRTSGGDSLLVGQRVTGIVILVAGDSSPVPLFVVRDPVASP